MTALKPYPHYQSSGVEWLGDIPAGWEVKKLKYIANLGSGESITSETIEAEGAYPVYGGNGFRGYTANYTHDGNYALIGRQGAWCGNINYAFGKFWASEHAVVVSIIGKDSYYWLGELLTIMNLNQYSLTAAQPGLAADFIKNLDIPTPTIPEQTRIAAFLDVECGKIDALIAKSEKMIALLDEKRQAVITHSIFGDNPSLIRLKFKLIKIGSGVTPRGGAQVYQDSGVLLIRSQNVHFSGMRLDDVAFISEEIDAEMINSRIHEGDVLLNITGASIGRCNFVGKDFPKANVNQHVCILRPSKAIRSEYLNYCLQTTTIQQQIDSLQTGSSREGLNFEQIGNLIIPSHNTEEQAKIVQTIETKTAKIDVLKAKIIMQAELLKERKTSLITAAVTGKIDVRDYQIQQEAA